VAQCATPESCTSAVDSSCTQCQSGYWRSNSLPTVCTACTPIAFCVSALTCTSAAGSVCTECAAGFQLNASGTACVDVNECLDGNNGGCSTDPPVTCRNNPVPGQPANCDPCPPGYTDAVCTNTPGSRTCACAPGFTGDGVNCTDVNECQIDNGGCSVNAVCTNTPGSRTCACGPGYVGDGFTCTAVVRPAEARFRPDEVDAICLFGACELDGGSARNKHRHATFRDWDERHGRRRDDHDRDRDEDDRDDGREHCPAFLRVSIELPAGMDPRTIDFASVRLAGTVAPVRFVPGLVDSDRDGVRERRFVFRFSDVTSLLTAGSNTLRVTGSAGGVLFAADAVLRVKPLQADMKVSPETLDRSSSRGDVRVSLDLDGGLRGADVEIASLRLEGVAVERVVSVRRDDVVVEFDRSQLLAVVPNGSRVRLTLTGRVRGIPFEATDTIRVQN
jgi:hypothetical protein